MFRPALQRQVQLGHALRRQLSSLSALQPASAQRSIALATQRVTSQSAALRPSTLLRCIPQRFYSSESAALQRESESTSSQSSSGPITRFDELSRLDVHDKLIKALTKGMRYTNMTDVQSLTINPALKGVDLVAQARTGTGKTLAFLVPVFQRLLISDPSLADSFGSSRASSEDIRAIILSPTRELAEQIGVEARKLAQGTGIVVQTAVGGTRKREALFQMRRQGCHLLVATPGRLLDILSDPQSGVSAPRLQALVLDEADRMLDVGFSDALRDIINTLPPIEEVDRQTLLFSATIPRDVVHLAKEFVKTNNFEFVQTINDDEVQTHESVPQHLVAVRGYENWLPAVMEIIDKATTKEDAPPFKGVLFFSNTASVQFANKVLRRTGFFKGRDMPIFDIHSRLTQAARTRSADNFRNSETGLLVSSDVTARGMDFPGVTHVIQVGLPPDRDQYIHRVGRTGRAGASGEGWLVLAEDEIPEARQRLTDLPIVPNKTLETSQVDLSQGIPEGPAAKYFEQIQRGYSQVDPAFFGAVYYSTMGMKCGRRFSVEDVVTLLNGWCKYGLGWDEPPAVSHSSAMKRGLSRIRGLKIGEPMRPPADNTRPDFGRRGKPARERYQDSRSSQRENRNPFESRFKSASRDGPRERRGYSRPSSSF